MLATLTRGWRWLGHRLSRAFLSRKLLGLPRGEPTAAPGLVLIQIDGLPRGELAAARNRGQMPFLDRLVAEEGYRLEPFYSGVPSTTPAVQAELFYGVRQAVPAFAHVDRATGQRRRLFESATARAKEAELAAQGEALLAGGSAYGDIYTGGAAEAHFCIADMGWDRVVKDAGGLRLVLLALTHAASFVRMLGQGMAELGHALAEADPFTDRRHWRAELKFIPTRVAISAVLREFQVMGARVDIARGRPIIHLNFLAYDENAHRRGPASAFARRALPGLDSALKRIWRAAAQAPTRDYQVWIYSDHGQEAVESFAAERGESFEQAVAQLLARLDPSERGPAPGSAPAQGSAAGRGGRPEGPYGAGSGEQSQRVRQLGGARFWDKLPRQAYADRWPVSPAVTVAAMGPLGHIYLGRDVPKALKAALARALVAELGVPLVVAPAGQLAESAVAITPAGRTELTGDPAAVLGTRHPYGPEAAADLAALAAHPDSGDLIASGWRPDGAPLSFPVERGAHGGPGAQETDAFALLPAETPPPPRTSAAGAAYRRPIDLRAAARWLLGRDGAAPGAAPPLGRRAGTRRLRVVTYNVHACRGLDGRCSPRRIASVLAQLDPDIVALQELDVGRARSGHTDQAQAIAEHLAMAARFNPAMRVEEEAFGDALLTRLPDSAVGSLALPRPPRDRGWAEDRGALAATIHSPAGPLRVVTTHLGLRKGERRAQAAALARSGLFDDPACPDAPLLVLGDFNARLASREMAPLTARLGDALTRQDAGPGRRRTFFTALPTLAIDHILVDPRLLVRWAAPWRSRLAGHASDHLPLVADIVMPDSD